MRELSIAGFIAIGFGLGSFYATNHFGAFSIANLAIGGLAFGVALVGGARRLRAVGGPYSRRAILGGLSWIALALTVAVALERGAERADVRFDWTFEGRYEPAPATVKALDELCGPVEVLLFYDPLDPRIRRTRLLVDTLQRYGDLSVRELQLDEVPDEIDAYGVGTSNSLVLRRDERFEVVERPTEGAIYEALYRLCAADAGVILTLRGEGEGDVERESEIGYAGLAAALATEGYRVRSAVTAALEEVSADVDAVLLLGPERHLHPSGLAALRRYLARGGSLIGLIEPGQDTGVEEILAEYGLQSPNGVLIDPASGSFGDEARGTSIVAYNYEQHPVTTGLDRNRMTYFPGARTFRLRKVDGDDRLSAVVQSSPRSWVSEDVGVLEGRTRTPERNGARENYHPIAVTGRYLRDGVETRIFAVGDADFASNRHLRTLYNLDLILNGIHWTLAREASITLRPKIRDTVQFPLPVTDSLQTLYGVGLLLPELLLIAGAVVWIRRRSA